MNTPADELLHLSQENAKLRSDLKKALEEKAVYEHAAETLRDLAKADTERVLELHDQLNQAVKRAQVAEDERDALRKHLLGEADRQSVINLMQETQEMTQREVAP